MGSGIGFRVQWGLLRATLGQSYFEGTELNNQQPTSNNQHPSREFFPWKLGSAERDWVLGVDSETRFRISAYAPSDSLGLAGSYGGQARFRVQDLIGRG